MAGDQPGDVKVQLAVVVAEGAVEVEVLGVVSRILQFRRVGDLEADGFLAALLGPSASSSLQSVFHQDLAEVIGQRGRQSHQLLPAEGHAREEPARQ